MTKRTPIHAAIATLSAAAIAVALAACSGGNGGPVNTGEPCCNATGVTEQPSGFAAVPGPLFAQPFALSSSQCIALDSGTLVLDNIVEEIAGDPVQVAPDGTYTVTVLEGFEGRLIGMRIFNGTEDDPLDRGLAMLPDRAAPRPESSPFRVPPITFDLANGRFGETTIETGLFCIFSRDGLMEDMDHSDVRAAVTRDIADAFVPGGGLSFLLQRTQHYRHAINSLVAVAQSNGEYANLKALRGHAEALVDSCKLGQPLDIQMTECGQGSRRAEFYRVWSILKYAESFGVTFGGSNRFEQSVLAWSQDLAEHVFDQPIDPSPVDQAARFSAIRLSNMIRYEVSHRALMRALQCFGDPDGDADGDGDCEQGTVVFDATQTNPASGQIYPRLDETFVQLRSSLAMATDTAGMYSAWTDFGQDVTDNFSVQAGVAPGTSTETMTQYYGTGIQQANSAQLAIDNTAIWTNAAIRERLYDSPNGILFVVRAELDSTTNTAISNLSAEDKDRVAEIIFYAAGNAVPIPAE